MKKVGLIIIVGIMALCFGCGEDINEREVTIITEGPQVLLETSMRGVVKDEQGNPVDGAMVIVGSDQRITDSNGEYEFDFIILEKGRRQIQISKDGYFTKSDKVSNEIGGEMYSESIILNRGAGEVADLSTSDEWTTADNVLLKFGTNSILRENGTPYNGEVLIYSRYIDPTSPDFLDSRMGDLSGRNAAGELVALQPVLMMNLELETIGGDKLLINESDRVEIEFPIPTGTEDLLEDEIPSWIFDLEEEFWLEDVVCYPSSGGGNYGCTIGGTGAWCCCVPKEGIEIHLRVFNGDSLPGSYLKTKIYDPGTPFIFGGYTNSLGIISGTVPKDEALILSIDDLCGNELHYDNAIGPYNSNAIIPDVWLDETVEQFSINVQGVLEDCSGVPVAEGWINVRYPEYERAFPVNSDGTYDFDVYFNCTQFPNVEMIGYDYANALQSLPVYHSQLSNVQVGNQPSCENLTSSLNLTDGTNTVEMFPVTYGRVWSSLTDDFISVEIPGGSFYSVVEDYYGVGTYTVDIKIINDVNVAPDLSGFSGNGTGLTLVVTSDDGSTLQGNLSGVISQGASLVNIDIEIVAVKKI